MDLFEASTRMDAYSDEENHRSEVRAIISLASEWQIASHRQREEQPHFVSKG